MTCTTNTAPETSTSTPIGDTKPAAAAMNPPAVDWHAVTRIVAELAPALAPLAAEVIANATTTREREALSRLVASIPFETVYEIFRDAERAGVGEGLLEVAYAGVRAERAAKVNAANTKSAIARLGEQLAEVANLIGDTLAASKPSEAADEDLDDDACDEDLDDELDDDVATHANPTTAGAAMADLFNQARGAALEDLLAQARGAR